MLSKRLIPIKSSCFDRTAYFGGRAAFRYHNGRVIFREIPVQLWQRFMAAASKGKFFNQEIKRSPKCGEVAKGADARGCVQSAPGSENPRSDCSLPRAEARPEILASR